MTTPTVFCQAPFSDANWVSLGGLPGANANIFATVVNTNTGAVYVGGTFTAAGTAIASGVAQWDGSAWTSLGSGLGGVVRALVLDTTGPLCRRRVHQCQRPGDEHCVLERDLLVRAGRGD